VFRDGVADPGVYEWRKIISEGVIDMVSSLVSKSRG